MNQAQLNEQLTNISTMWTKIREANQGDAAAGEAQQVLMNRYCGAIYRYLLAAVRHPDQAEELTQEFALRFVQGRFRNADPTRGRFRDYVKTCLFNLVTDYRQRRAKVPAMVALDAHEPAVLDDPAASDKDFRRSWRQELLARAWQELEQMQERTGRPYYTVLRFRVDHPGLRSPQIAEQLAGPLGKPLNSAWVRKTIERARAYFGDLVIDETLRALGPGAADCIEEELAELKLLKYCQEALDRRKGDSAGAKEPR